MGPAMKQLGAEVIHCHCGTVAEPVAPYIEFVDWDSAYTSERGLPRKLVMSTRKTLAHQEDKP
jgi:hypothetical protein